MTQLDFDSAVFPNARRKLTRRALKRAMDVVGASLGLIFLSPLLLLVAAAILISEGRPVFYSHSRVGRRGRSFGCLKFRTMARDGDRRLAAHLASDPAARAEWEETRKLKRDPRVGCLGNILRRTSLDELPQLFNVLRGEMSLVGPRPVVSDEARFYGPHFEAYKSVRPGLTGAWQVSGRSDTTYDERVALDVGYVREGGTRTDIAIMLRTVGVLLSGRGAC